MLELPCINDPCFLGTYLGGNNAREAPIRDVGHVFGTAFQDAHPRQPFLLQLLSHPVVRFNGDNVIPFRSPGQDLGEFARPGGEVGDFGTLHTGNLQGREELLDSFLRVGWAMRIVGGGGSEARLGHLRELRSLHDDSPLKVEWKMKTITVSQRLLTSIGHLNRSIGDDGMHVDHVNEGYAGSTSEIQVCE